MFAIAGAPQKQTCHAPARTLAPPTPGGNGAEQGQERERHPCHPRDQPPTGRQCHCCQRQQRADRKARGQGPCGLNRTGGVRFGDAELVALMGTDGGVRPQLLGHLPRQARFELSSVLA